MNQKQVNTIVRKINQQERLENFKNIILRNVGIVQYEDLVEVTLVPFDITAGIDISMVVHENMAKMFEDIISKSINYRFEKEYEEEMGLDVFKIMVYNGEKY